MKQEKDFWFDVGPLHAIPPRGARTVRTPRREIAIFRTAGDEVFALENRCPHKGGPLADGIVSGESVVCPLHGWKINLACGSVDRPADTGACIETYPVRIDNGIIVVGLPASFAPKEAGAAA